MYNIYIYICIVSIFDGLKILKCKRKKERRRESGREREREKQINKTITQKINLHKTFVFAQVM